MQWSLNEIIELLCSMIATPSLSRNESVVADLVEQSLRQRGIESHRHHNNIWALCRNYSPERPTLMLNSHLDTVRPSDAWTRDPYTATREQGRIYGLGSNDAGASAVALLATFCRYYEQELPFNLLLAITAEEEVTGENGMRALVKELEQEEIKVDMAIVGEPTQMQAAIGERGLVVLDCTAHGRSGHAARNEGENAIYKALKDIERLRTLSFERTSSLLGEIKITTTQIEAGYQHNIVPDKCHFVVDIRTTDAYTNEQTVELIRSAVESEVTPRSTRIQAAVIAESHPLMVAATALGCTAFVSPTTSDRTVMPFPALKIGIGDSARSHSADEYVLESELQHGVELYAALIEKLKETI